MDDKDQSPEGDMDGQSSKDQVKGQGGDKQAKGVANAGKPTAKKGGLSAYHHHIREPNQVITQSILSARSHVRSPAAQQAFNLRASAALSDDEQQIISTSIQVKRVPGAAPPEAPQNLNLPQNAAIQNKNSIDHSSLFVQNSPRARNTMVARLQPGGRQSSKAGFDRDSHLRETIQGMNPVFGNRGDDMDEGREGEPQQNSSIQPKGQQHLMVKNTRTTVRMNSQHTAHRPRFNQDIIRVEANQLPSGAGSLGQHQTQADLMGSQQISGEGGIDDLNLTKQMNSMAEGSLLAKPDGVGRSRSPTGTQKGVEMGQSSTYSVQDKDPSFLSGQAMKVDIQEKNKVGAAVNKRNSEIDALHLKSGLSKLESVSVHDAKLDLLSQQDAARDHYVYSQFANPFNVQSFQTQAAPKPESAAPALLKQQIQGSEVTETQNSQQRNPTKVEVYKVYDFVKSGRAGDGQPRAPPSPTAAKASENFINQIMKPPRMTNYEVLKRPKTNKDEARPTKVASATDTSAFVLDSQRDTSTHMEGVVSSDEAFTVTRSRRANPETAREVRNLAVYRTDAGQAPNGQSQQRQYLKKRIQGRRPQLASQGAARPAFVSSPATPNCVSKKYAGGFGGVGSIYTHSHLTNTRKFSHYRMTHGEASSGKWPLQIKADQKAKMFSQRDAPHSRGYNSSLDSGDFLVAGNRAGDSLRGKRTSALPDVRPARERQTLAGVRYHNDTSPLSIDTSRTPIPIDPESYKNMHKFLPQKMDASSNEGAASPQDRSLSSSAGKQNADLQQVSAGRPFIMSPQNLQETLKKQQEALKPAQKVQDARGSKTGKPSASVGPVGARLLMQNGKRKKISAHKLNMLAIKDQQTSSSGQGLLDPVQQNMIAKHMNDSNWGFNSTGTMARERKTSHMTGMPDIIPPVEGKQFRGTETRQVKAESLLHTRDAGDLANPANVFAIQAQARQNQGSHGPLFGTEQPKDVSVRINKINIEINPEHPLNATATSKAVGTSQHERGSMESREHINFSGLTNYNNSQPAAIFDEAAAKASRLHQQGHNSNSPQSREYKSQNPSQRKFAPVLKSKSYLAHESQPPAPGKAGTAEFARRLELEARRQNASNSRQSRFEHARSSQAVGEDDGRSDGEAAWAPAEITRGEEPELDIRELKHGNTTSMQSDYDALSPPLLAGGLAPTYTGETHLSRRNRDVDVATTTFEQEMVQDDESSDDVSPHALRNMLRLDECRREDFGKLDFVALKTFEFLAIQKKLRKLDYNSLNSDRRSTIEARADLMLKDIALCARRKYSRFASAGGQHLFDINQRKNMHINSQVPMNIMTFKNKSEQTRYMRVANCILALNDSNSSKSRSDVEFTYMKIFRFLADVLTHEEFELISYFHVSRFISNILQLAFEDNKTNPKALSPVSLRQFVCDSLELGYEQTVESRDMLLRPGQFGKATEEPAALSPAQQLMAAIAAIKTFDLYDVYTERSVQPGKQRHLDKDAEARHQQIQDQITRQVWSFAHEPGLSGVIRSAYFKEKETIKRQNLASLLKSSKNQNDLDYQNLSKESTLARNKIVCEHVIASRNMRDWKDQVLAEIHVEQREKLKKSRNSKSQSQQIKHRSHIITRIY